MRVGEGLERRELNVIPVFPIFVSLTIAGV